MGEPSGTLGAVAPESLSKQLCGAPMGTVGDMIQMRPATICLMADRYKAESGEKERWRGRKTVGRTDEGLSITFGKGTKADTALVIRCYLSLRACNSKN